MPIKEKKKHLKKKERQAEHVEEGYLERGMPEDEAERRARATAYGITGGGRKRGLESGKAIGKASAEKGGEKRGAAPRG